jgi:hypothetical protein
MSTDPNRTPPPGWEAQAARFALISDVVLLIARSTELEDLLLQAVNRIKWVFDFNRCTLALTDKGGETYTLRTLLETRRDQGKVEKSGVSLDAGLHGKVIGSGQPYIEADISASPAGLPESGTGGWLVPLGDRPSAACLWPGDRRHHVQRDESERVFRR